jgi:uncharacterized protein YqeY
VSLLAQIQQELKAAMLAKNADRLATLRLLKSAIGYAQIEKKNENLPEAELIAIVQKEIKKRRDSIEQFEAGGRPELAAKEAAEIQVLEQFLPRQLTGEELEQLIRDVIRDIGATGKKDMGPVIKAVQAKATGRADGKTISGVVSRLLP